VPTLTHLDEAGAMRMVNVGKKNETHRMARAEARVLLGREARAALRVNDKGDVFAAARVAGIQAAKRTGELIPLCHPLPLTHVSVTLTEKRWGVVIEACAETVGRTGVEMEALCAVSIAALTIYDMLKAIDRNISIEQVALTEKSGGNSGHYRRAKSLANHR
jgi:cyclic pyranopterin monophosphate synthase